MRQPLPNTPFLPATDDVMEQFVNLLEFLFLSGCGHEGTWQAEPPWFLHSPEEIVADLKKQCWGADLGAEVDFQFFVDKGLVQKLPIICLLRTQHPLTFVFRIYCQRHGSALENWMDGWVTEREFADLKGFISAMHTSEIQIGQAESQAELVQALEHLVDHDFSGTVWCDWNLTKFERAMFVEMSKEKSITLIDKAICKPHMQNAAKGAAFESNV